MNPRVFVTGCTRSGTTLLQRILDGHPDLAVSNDTHVVPRSVLAGPGGPDLPMSGALLEEVVGHTRFSRLGVDATVARRFAGEAPRFADFVRALFGEAARLRGKPYAGEKDPEYVRRIPLLGGLFPEARFVHIIRDGRDVAVSTLAWVTPRRFLGQLELWQREPVGVCALWWRRQVLAGLTGGLEVGPDRCLEVRYEDLVGAPAPTAARVASFLDLPPSDEMLDYHVGRTRSAAGLSSKDRWLPPTPGLRDFRRGLGPDAVQLFESLAGDLLEALGYPLAAATVDAEVRARAAECRRWWERRFDTTLAAVPAGCVAGAGGRS